MEVTGTLEDWTIIPIDVEGHILLAGHIYGDIKSRFVDGTAVLTSRIMLYEGGIAFTKNSAYKLGTPYDVGNVINIEELNKQKKIGE